MLKNFKTERERLEKSIFIAEFFKGTGSFEKEAKKYGIKTWTTDIDKNCNPDLCKNILDIEKEDIPKDVNVLWFSTPCDQYSHAHRVGKRNLKYADDCAEKCLKIISWFPNAIYFIENPQTGLLKDRDFMNGLPYFDVSYCKYGLPYRKQTRIWTNFIFWTPKNICKKDCEFIKNGKHIMSVGNGRIKYTLKNFSTKEKYKIPEELCSEIIQSILTYKKAKLTQLNECEEICREKIENKELLERLSDLEHKQWVHWTEYMMKSIHDEDKFIRWEKQIKIPYSKLSEEDKEKDRIWARKVLEELKQNLFGGEK